MATSAASAASSLSAAPVPQGSGGASASTRGGAAPTGAFASLLNQLSQSMTASATATAPDSVVASAPAPTLLDQPVPTASIVAPAPPPAATPSLQAAASLGSPNVQPSNPNPGTGPKTANTRAKSDISDRADPLPPVSISEATPSVPVPELPLASAISPTLMPLTVAGASTASAANTAVSTLEDSLPPAAPAGPAATPAAAKTTVAAASSQPAAMPTSSRIADQAAAAAQAGLSVGDDRGSGVASPEQEIEAQLPTSAISHPAPPGPLPLLHLASVAIPAAPADSIAPIRGGASALAHVSEPEAISQPSSSSNLGASPTEPPPASTSDIQGLPQILPPPAALTAAGPANQTRPAQAAPSLPSPATQVAQAIAEPVKVILTSPAQAGPTTSHVTTIQITPAELGRVEIRIERANDGPAKIQLIAERSETLSCLVHDQSHLQQALDHAGIPQSSRTLEFSLAPATANGSALSSSLAGNDTSGGESSANGYQRQNTAYHNPNSNGTDDPELDSTTQSRIVRTVIDITA